MNFDKLKDLKRQIAEAADFKDPFNYFLDHFGDREEFHDLGERTSHPKLEQMLEILRGDTRRPSAASLQLPHRSRSPAIVPARHLPHQRKGGQLHLLRRRSARPAGDPAREPRRCDADHAFYRAGPTARLAAVGELTRLGSGSVDDSGYLGCGTGIGGLGAGCTVCGGAVSDGIRFTVRCCGCSGARTGRGVGWTTLSNGGGAWGGGGVWALSS